MTQHTAAKQHWNGAIQVHSPSVLPVLCILDRNMHQCVYSTSKSLYSDAVKLILPHESLGLALPEFRTQMTDGLFKDS